MKNIKLIFSLLSLVLLLGCKYDTIQPAYTYPQNISQIIVPNCAVPGCHNTISAPGASGLDFTTIQTMFQGNTAGSVVIPYAGNLSPMMYFCNPYSDLGAIHILPSMPYNLPPLSHSQVQQLYDWISAGAPDANGFVMFSDNPNRRKYYAANQGCDEVAVFDAQSKVIMRYVSVGTGLNPNGGAEPHQLRISPDGQYWYPVFYNAQLLQKFSCANDQLVGSVQLPLDSSSPDPLWSSMCITSDSKYGFIISFDEPGKIAYIDLENMQFKFYIGSPGEMVFPHGSYLTKDNKTLYVTAQTNNFIYKINVANLPNYIISNVSLGKTGSLQPHEIRFTPDESEYFVTCQGTDQVRILQTGNDSLLSIIQLPTGSFPQEMAVDSVHHHLFVSCQDGPSANGWEGEVAIIDYQTNTLIAQLTNGLYQPHGLAVDEDNQRVYVVSLDFSTTGPPPHHVGICGGRNGYIDIIDMNTLNFLPNYQDELLTFPYWVEYRH